MLVHSMQARADKLALLGSSQNWHGRGGAHGGYPQHGPQGCFHVVSMFLLAHVLIT